MEYAKACKEFELLGFVEENPKEKIRISNLASKDIKCIAGFDDFGALNCEYKMTAAELLIIVVSFQHRFCLNSKLLQNPS